MATVNINPVCTKERAILLAGGKAKLARLLGVLASSVSQWDEDRPIPAQRALQLAILFPDAFNQDVDQGPGRVRGKRR